MVQVENNDPIRARSLSRLRIVQLATVDTWQKIKLLGLTSCRGGAFILVSPLMKKYSSILSVELRRGNF